MPEGPILQDKLDHRLVLVTGPSGAGRSTAVNVLEDLGREYQTNRCGCHVGTAWCKVCGRSADLSVGTEANSRLLCAHSQRPTKDRNDAAACQLCGH